jgi:hypothetical protein
MVHLHRSVLGWGWVRFHGHSVAASAGDVDRAARAWVRRAVPRVVRSMRMSARCILVPRARSGLASTATYSL